MGLELFMETGEMSVSNLCVWVMGNKKLSTKGKRGEIIPIDGDNCNTFFGKDTLNLGSTTIIIYIHTYIYIYIYKEQYKMRKGSWENVKIGYKECQN